MIIGKINDKINAEVTVTGFNNDTVIPPLENGNPTKNETLKLYWTQVHSMAGIDIHLKLEKGFWINNLVLHLGDDCEVYKIKAFNSTREMPLCEYSGETGKKISEKSVVLPVECDDESIILSMEATDANNVTIVGIDIFGARLEDVLFPQVEDFCEIPGKFLLPEDVATIYADEPAKQAGAILSEKYFEQTGIMPSVVQNGKIRLLYNESIEKNGYHLTVNDEGVIISASDLRGFVYGCEVLLKLMRNGRIPFVSIKDKPHKSFRGVHVYLPAMEDIPFFKRYVKYILSPLGYNAVIIELAGAFEFKTHPEINRCFEESVEKGLSGQCPPFPHGGVGGGKTIPQETVRELVRYVQSFGMEAIPEVQSLSHVEYLTVAYPELAETSSEPVPLTKKDGRSDFYLHDYCPSNPKTYEIMFDLLSEVLTVFEPCRYVHMGHDELQRIGTCPLCKGKSPAELYASDIWKYRDFLSERGARMMIWADMVSRASRNKDHTAPAIEMIPKDVILLDFIWYVYPSETEDALLPYVQDVMVGNFYSSHYERAEERLAKSGMIGGEVSMWTKTKEETIAAEGKLYDLFYSAQMLWSKSFSSLLRYTYDKLIQKEISYVRQSVQDKKYPSLNGYKESVIEDKGEFSPKNETGGIFTVNKKLSSLVFEHTAQQTVFRQPWTPFDKLGKYVIKYVDGSEEEVPVTYTGNISCWCRRFGEPFKGRYYRHNGYIGAMWYTSGIEGRLKDGRCYTLYRYEWINPKPDVTVLSVEYVSSENAKSEIIINKLSSFSKEDF